MHIGTKNSRFIIFRYILNQTSQSSVQTRYNMSDLVVGWHAYSVLVTTNKKRRKSFVINLKELKATVSDDSVLIKVTKPEMKILIF